MLHTIQKYCYTSFGLTIDSELLLPELLPSQHVEGVASSTVTIQYGNLSQSWNERKSSSKYLAVCADIILVHIPDTAIFGMIDGNCMIVSPMVGADEKKIRLYLYGTCMGILLLQRRTLPLHGSAVVIGDKAYAIVGESGAGKSTLSSYLLEQGYQLLSDDLIAVTIQNQIPYAMPAYPQQKMWQETIDLLGKSSAGLTPIFDRESKFAVPVTEKFCHHSVPLAGIFELVKTEKNAAIQPIYGLNRFSKLLQHTFRGFLLKQLGLLDWHFQTITSFANQIDMFQLQRPIVGSSVHKLSELVVHAAGERQ